jgi:hypothetical protein
MKAAFKRGVEVKLKDIDMVRLAGNTPTSKVLIIERQRS